jgi:hypothetical protein
LLKPNQHKTPQEHYLPLQTNSLQAKLATSGEHIMFAKTFRNTLVSSSLLVGASLLAGPAAQAQIANGEVGGSIAPISTLTFTLPAAAALTPLTAGSFAMGSLNVRNNDPQGWIVVVTSTNAGELQNQAATTPANVYITYSDLTVADSLAAFDATPLLADPALVSQTLVDAPHTEAVATAVVNSAVSATIAATGTVDGGTTSVALAGLPTGTYTDTLTFTLTSK